MPESLHSEWSLTARWEPPERNNGAGRDVDRDDSAFATAR